MTSRNTVTRYLHRLAESLGREMSALKHCRIYVGSHLPFAHRVSALLQVNPTYSPRRPLTPTIDRDDVYSTTSNTCRPGMARISSSTTAWCRRRADPAATGRCRINYRRDFPCVIRRRCPRRHPDRYFRLIFRRTKPVANYHATPNERMPGGEKRMGRKYYSATVASAQYIIRCRTSTDRKPAGKATLPRGSTESALLQSWRVRFL